MAEQQHRATAGEWASIRARADDMVTYSTILELLHRIEALEAASQSAQSNHPAKPDGLLVDRVEDAILTNGNDPGFRAEARAAICEVAAWMREHKQFGAAVWSQRIKEEAER